MDEHRPLRVTLYLATQMVEPDAPIHLDAILAWAAVDRAGDDWGEQDNLPLARHFTDHGQCDWVWKASQFSFRILNRDQMPSVRTFEPWAWGDEVGTLFNTNKNSVAAGTGPLKAYQLTTPLIQVQFATAWCIGDPREVENLLSRVTHLGAKRRLDMGRIHRVDIAVDEEAEKRWQHRAMPEQVPGYLRAIACLRSPYWRRENRVECWVPPCA